MTAEGSVGRGDEADPGNGEEETMSSYILLIHGDEELWESWTEEQAVANARAHEAFNAKHRDAVVGGHELERSWHGRSVRLDAEGRSRVDDGPFSPVASVLGGFYLVEALDLDHAVRIAADLPEASAPSSGVEVRPLARP
jgi:hypothetical protein